MEEKTLQMIYDLYTNPSRVSSAFGHHGIEKIAKELGTSQRFACAAAKAPLRSKWAPDHRLCRPYSAAVRCHWLGMGGS